jgi:hypothetical protein
MMLVVSRWMMWALAGALFFGCEQPSGPLSLPPAVGRPDEASQGPRVGVIVARGGEVTIVPSKGSAFSGLPDRQLLRDDKLVTAANSFVVVQLHNGHFVRLGASQSNVVEMLAPFHDPPAGEDVEDRFVRLLTPEERDDPELSGAITRVAGWNTRMSAAESFAALPAVQKPPMPEAPGSGAPRAPSVSQAPAPISAPEADMAGNGEGRPADEVESAKQSPKPAPKRRETESKSETRRPSPDDAGSKSKDSSAPPTDAPKAEEAEEAQVPPAAPPAPAPAPAPAQLPGQLKFTPTKGRARLVDLPEPFKSGAAALAKCAGAGAKVTGSVLQGKVSGLKVSGANKCQDLVGKATTLEDGTFELTVKP